jgi:formylglycine-generating enzyme required for sulfatase activity
MGSTPVEVQELLRDLEQLKPTAFDKFVATSSAPQHRVRLSQPYYIGEYEVTVAQFQQFSEATKQATEKSSKATYFWRDYVTEDPVDQQPVVGVSWDDAQAFCRWLSEREKLKYDLPTEAQWEFACRAGTQTLWSGGNGEATLENQAVYGFKTATPSRIGQKAANSFGLYDMHGNVPEWCVDWHVSSFYTPLLAIDPVCLNAPNDPGSGRVARGGSWNSDAWWSRSAVRDYDSPSLPVRAKGFRVVIRGNLKPPAQAEKPIEPQ